MKECIINVFTYADTKTQITSTCNAFVTTSNNFTSKEVFS